MSRVENGNDFRGLIRRSFMVAAVTYKNEKEHVGDETRWCDNVQPHCGTRPTMLRTGSITETAV